MFLKTQKILYMGLAMLWLINPSYAKKLEKVDLYIPPVGVGLLMVQAAKDPALKKYVKKINVIRWNTPDQMRAGMIDKTIDITFVPSYTGANFYNKGVDFRLMNIITGGILYVLSKDESIKSIKDLKGKTVAVPFQNDMPDLVFQALLEKNNLKIGKDVTIEYTSSPMIAAKKALLGMVDTVLLPEVAGTAIAIKAKKMRGITFHRSIDISKEYGKSFDTDAYIPQAGVAVRNSFYKNNKAFISALHKAMVKAAKTLKNNKKTVIATTETVWKGQGKIFAKSLPFWHLDVQSARAVKSKLEKFYRIMEKLNPAIIGGKLPNKSYYLAP